MLYLGKSNTSSSQREDTAVDWPQFYDDSALSAKDVRLKAFYSESLPHGKTPLERIDFVALDFETTGFDPKRNGILSIGLVPFTLRRIHCASAKYWVVRPRAQLDHASVAIHGITHSDVQSAPDFMRIVDHLLAALAGKVVVVHHRGIERPFLDAALRKRIHEGIAFPVIDTMELEARLHRAKPMNLMDKLLNKEPASIRLVDSRARYNLPYYQQHHALTDALATAELLLAQIAHRFSPDTPIDALWL
ncbi:3'-5' exonuclease [Nitrincola alkalisediminis]|uniref:3'-5' exonuclease n=1 Tax=Nitrincola alkalisediminis TaxID=1366656 RepID=UPI0018771D4D|nr:3'-5' exonuclease [Nitrincola alkalisediminis]